MSTLCSVSARNWRVKPRLLAFYLLRASSVSRRSNRPQGCTPPKLALPGSPDAVRWAQPMFRVGSRSAEQYLWDSQRHRSAAPITTIATSRFLFIYSSDLSGSFDDLSKLALSSRCGLLRLMNVDLFRGCIGQNAAR